MLFCMTFPARGTWIEISYHTDGGLASTDVPRKGNVDRNSAGSERLPHCQSTFPARGTWIEMARTVAQTSRPGGRSPQGERG